MTLAILPRKIYDGFPYLRWFWEAVMPQEYGDDRLIFRLSSDDAIELESLGEGFGGLARQFRRHLADSGLDPDEVPAKLFVTNVQSGSLDFELATLASLYLAAQASADGYVIWMDFYDRIKGTLDYLADRAPRPKKYSRADAKDFDSFLRTIAGKRGANLNVKRAKFHQKSGKRETLAEFDFNEQDLANAHMKLAHDLTGLEQEDDSAKDRHKLETNVPFIWHRTDREKGKAHGQTSDRGVVAKVTDKPLPVFFASEIDNFKSKMTKVKYNPFDLVYLVDVSVGLDENDEPKSYTILNIHNIIGGDDGEAA